MTKKYLNISILNIFSNKRFNFCFLLLFIEHSGSTIPITVRQLEAVVRLSEALAKMELLSFAEERHVDEALRLFQVSTLAAAASGNLAGVEGFSTPEEQENFNRVEKQLKNRFAIGTFVSEHLIVDEFSRQNYAENVVKKVKKFISRKEYFARLNLYYWCI